MVIAPKPAGRSRRTVGGEAVALDALDLIEGKISLISGGIAQNITEEKLAIARLIS